MARLSTNETSSCRATLWAVGWYLITRCLGLILAGEREMNPDDYRLEGTLGRLTVGIPAGVNGFATVQTWVEITGTGHRLT